MSRSKGRARRTAFTLTRALSNATHRVRRALVSVLGRRRQMLLAGIHSLLTRLLTLPRPAIARLRMAVGVQPLSKCFGWERGLPVLRYYTEQFLHEFAGDIRGHCLEFQDPMYALRFGGASVSKLDTLHADASNPHASLVADLTEPNDLPSDRFDCIICTYVLHLIYDLRKAVSELHRVLKPGGVLLVAVPHVSMCDPEWHELWRFTGEGVHRLLAEAFGGSNVLVRTYGNSLTAAGQLRGLVTHEFSVAELGAHDPRFPVEVCARAVKCRH